MPTICQKNKRFNFVFILHDAAGFGKYLPSVLKENFQLATWGRYRKRRICFQRSHRNDGTAAAARQRSKGLGRFPNKQVCEEWSGGLFEKTSKLVPVYTACQVVKRPVRSRSFRILAHSHFGPISKYKSREPPVSRNLSADGLLKSVRIRCRKSACHKVASRGNLYRFPHFCRSARWPYPQKLLAGGSIPSPL